MANYPYKSIEYGIEYFPTKELVINMLMGKKAYDTNRYQMDPLWTPWGLLLSFGSFENLVKCLIAAIMAEYTDMSSAIAKVIRAKNYTGGNIDDIKKFIKENIDEFVNICLQVEKEENHTLKESFEKHNTLNPLIWNEDNTIKPEVSEKILLIVDEFLSGLSEENIVLNITDIVLVGSNCNYNYTKDSDLDVHIRCVLDSSECPKELYNKLYSAYRSIFNKDLDIDFYGIPVEIFVETEDSSISKGIYSVLNNKWIREPIKEDIPEINIDEFNKEFQVWEDRYNQVISDMEA